MRTIAKITATAAVTLAAGLSLAACGTVATKAHTPASSTPASSAPASAAATSSTTPAPVKTVIVQVPAPAPVAPAPVQPVTVNAEAVVDQYYQDITDGNYAAAWALGGDNIGGGSYSGWVAGYDTTASVDLGTASDFGSGQVTAVLYATQDDGTVNTYSGTYTVADGVIVAASITQS